MGFVSDDPTNSVKAWNDVKFVLTISSRRHSAFRLSMLAFICPKS